MLNGGSDVVFNVAGPAAWAFSRRPPTPTNTRSASFGSERALPKERRRLDAQADRQFDLSSIKQIKADKAPFGTLEIYGLKNDGVGLVYNDALGRTQ